MSSKDLKMRFDSQFCRMNSDVRRQRFCARACNPVNEIEGKPG
jgi:hypothetical protein